MTRRRIRIDLSAGTHWLFVRQGRTLHRDGYKYVWQEDRQKYVAEHRLAAEAALGRELKTDEEVHHVDGNKLHNAAPNLVVCRRDYHWYLDECRRIQNFLRFKRASMAVRRQWLKRMLRGVHGWLGYNRFDAALSLSQLGLIRAASTQASGSSQATSSTLKPAGSSPKAKRERRSR